MNFYKGKKIKWASQLKTHKTGRRKKSPLSLFFFFSPTFPSPLLLLSPLYLSQEQLHIEHF